MALENEEEIVEKLEDEQRQAVTKRTYSKLEAGHLFWIFLFFTSLYLMMVNGVFPKNAVYTIGGFAIILILFYLFREESGEKRLLREDEVKAIVKHELYEKKIKGERGFRGTTEILPNCKLQYTQNPFQQRLPMRWIVKVNIRDNEGLVTRYVVHVHPFDGIITGIIERPQGWLGDDDKDMIVITPDDWTGNVKD